MTLQLAMIGQFRRTSATDLSRSCDRVGGRAPDSVNGSDNEDESEHAKNDSHDNRLWAHSWAHHEETA